ncbi:hypothetical protein HDU83_004470 [Entophlyctis luteolus]|nr:hypothetical protein HDU83_004470 [Entophlyctis luteolus]KAJ3378639.1 hypothetical protein HDU84_007416 [Entophlyctis sp. JEL0112]
MPDELMSPEGFQRKVAVTESSKANQVEDNGQKTPTTLCGTPSTSQPSSKIDASESDVIFDEIVRCQEDWESERTELDLYLQQVRNLVHPGHSTSDAAEPRLFPNEETIRQKHKNESEETLKKILEGFSKIQQLDNILHEKTQILSQVSKPTTSSTDATILPTTHISSRDTKGFDNSENLSESGSDAFELRSVGSFKNHTFITEPRLMARKLGSRRTLQSAKSSYELSCSAEGPDKSNDPNARILRGYRLGDFVQRNIVLGPQARYYHAMTEVEQDRVERLLKEKDYDEADSEEEESKKNTESASDVNFQ